MAQHNRVNLLNLRGVLILDQLSVRQWAGRNLRQIAAVASATSTNPDSESRNVIIAPNVISASGRKLQVTCVFDSELHGYPPPVLGSIWGTFSPPCASTHARSDRCYNAICGRFKRFCVAQLHYFPHPPVLKNSLPDRMR